jgi:Na+-translocating ferredoxin:NAD+ oxidoreductase RnfG subunit
MKDSIKLVLLAIAALIAALLVAGVYAATTGMVHAQAAKAPANAKRLEWFHEDCKVGGATVFYATNRRTKQVELLWPTRKDGTCKAPIPFSTRTGDVVAVRACWGDRNCSPWSE